MEGSAQITQKTQNQQNNVQIDIVIDNIVFYDLSTIQEFQYCQLYFWLCYLKLKRPGKSATLKGNPFLPNDI